MAIYAQLQTASYSPVGLNAMSWNGTRGKAIMDQFAVSQATMPFTADQIAVAMDLYYQAMQGHWTWNPRSASANGAGLLDQDDLDGECAQLAWGFLTLLRSPAPYGFGLSQTQASILEWPGTGSPIILFVAEHAGAHFGLHPNILKNDWANLGGAMRFQNSYAWGNHKVVRVDVGGSMYFDPCYNEVYLLPHEMADCTLTDTEFELMGKNPIMTKYRGKDRYGQPIEFKALGSATPEVLKAQVRTLSNMNPVLMGPA
jgi:hypothetical protein